MAEYHPIDAARGDRVDDLDSDAEERLEKGALFKTHLESVEKI